MNKLLNCIILLILVASASMAQTQADTVKAYITSTAVTIDGQADEACWQNTQWHAIDQVWMPFGATMQTGDFEGKFKVAWDEQYFYILVEVVDDSLSDDHTDPLSNWWDDDCLEIFIDENRSMGNHECNNNAFAYHVSLKYDAIDLSPACGGINYKDHVIVDMDTIGQNTYLWEMAFKIYGDNYNHNAPENSRITLTPNKLMGLAVAYCDNDETTSRENFIGSMQMTAATNNEMYKNANYFGPMLLIDPDYVSVSDAVACKNELHVYPNPFENQILVESAATIQSVQILSLSSQILKTIKVDKNECQVQVNDLPTGMYILQVNTDAGLSSQLISKQ